MSKFLCCLQFYFKVQLGAWNLNLTHCFFIILNGIFLNPSNSFFNLSFTVDLTSFTQRSSFFLRWEAFYFYSYINQLLISSPKFSKLSCNQTKTLCSHYFAIARTEKYIFEIIKSFKTYNLNVCSHSTFQAGSMPNLMNSW